MAQHVGNCTHATDRTTDQNAQVSSLKQLVRLMCHPLQSNLQVLVMGKISQAAVVAASAYRDEATFQRQTGITNSRLIHDREHHDTKVCALLYLLSLEAVQSTRHAKVLGLQSFPSCSHAQLSLVVHADYLPWSRFTPCQEMFQSTSVYERAFVSIMPCDSFAKGVVLIMLFHAMQRLCHVCWHAGVCRPVLTPCKSC